MPDVYIVPGTARQGCRQNQPSNTGQKLQFHQKRIGRFHAAFIAAFPPSFQCNLHFEKYFIKYGLSFIEKHVILKANMQTFGGDPGSKITAPKKYRARWVLAISFGLLLLLVFAWLRAASPSARPTKAIAWRLQPDQLPLGTVLQASEVEASLGFFSGLKPSPYPGFVARLPVPLRRATEWSVETYRTWIARSGWRLKVEAPPFVRIEQAEIQSHTTQGAFAFISVRLRTERPGQWQGKLNVRLTSGQYGSTNILVPLSANVLPSRGLSSRRVLITETPYECYATGNGRDFEPLAEFNSSLAQQGIRVDYRKELPSDLSGYSAILLGGGVLAKLNPAAAQRLGQFVSRGGRLILAADAFFVPTAPKANGLLRPYGLSIVNKDAGQGVTNSLVLADVLTSGVKHVEFWRPARIDVTEPAQGKLLVGAEDGEGGYVAVSRQKNRGDVIVLAQSLWWNWIRANPTNSDNRSLLKNFLAE